MPLFQDGLRTERKEGGKRGRKPGRKAADKVDMKAKLGEFRDIIILLKEWHLNCSEVNIFIYRKLAYDFKI